MHREQLRHVRKGCLERRRQDILSDGSRIEGSHKGWNSLQRAQPSGITVLVALGHDFVLRRNIRVGYSSITNSSTQPTGTFLTSTHGSHHVGLVAAIATLHNNILNVEVMSSIRSLPELSDIHSNEAFGLTRSDHASTFGGMIDVKEELDEVMMTESLGFEHDATADLAVQATRPVLEELHIDPSLLDQPWEAGARKSSELQVPLEPARSSLPVGSITAAKHKLESLLADEALGSRLSPAPELVESPIEVQTLPVETPPVTKRVRLGSDSLASITSAPTSQLDYYFKTMTRVPSTVTPCNAPKLMSPHSMSAQPSAPAGTPRHTTNSNKPFPTADGLTTNPSTMAMVTVCHQRALTTTSTDSPLMLPRVSVDGLTRSQRLFSLTTNIDPRSLLIQGDNEFYLFMDMRADFKWVSHEMTPKRWVNATGEYNKRLVAKKPGSGPSVVLKHPLALSRKLGELEPKLMNRIVEGNYKCKYYDEGLTKFD